MRIEFIAKFKRTTLSHRLTYLLLHEASLLEMRLTRVSQVTSLRGLAPTGRPRYLKLRDPSFLQFMKCFAQHKGVTTLTLMTLHLAKLTLCLEATSKHLRIVSRVQRFSIVVNTIMVLVYCKIEIYVNT